MVCEYHGYSLSMDMDMDTRHGVAIAQLLYPVQT